MTRQGATTQMILQQGLVATGLDPSKYHMGDDISARGPCFLCGGHSRMVIFIEREFPAWWISCDICGISGWLNRFFPNLQSGNSSCVEPRPVEEMNAELHEQMRAILQDFQNQMRWEKLHADLTLEARTWWRDKAGVPDDWQDFWKLGYTSGRTFKVRDVIFSRPAYSIPKFSLGWTAVNIDYRLIDPPLGAGRYRSEIGLPAALFIARPDQECLSQDGRLVIVEGSKKAMVVYLYLGATVQVIGVPGSLAWAKTRLVEWASQLQQVIIVFDPDAERAASKLMQLIGPAASRLTLPTKPDDAFLSGALNADKFWYMVKHYGRRT